MGAALDTEAEADFSTLKKAVGQAFQTGQIQPALIRLNAGDVRHQRHAHHVGRDAIVLEVLREAT